MTRSRESSIESVTESYVKEQLGESYDRAKNLGRRACGDHMKRAHNRRQARMTVLAWVVTIVSMVSLGVILGSIEIQILDTYYSRNGQ